MKFSCILAIVVALGGFVVGPVIAKSQENAAALLSAAQDMYQNEVEGNSRPDLSALREIREFLDEIVQDHPASDLARDILFRETLGEIDIAKLDTRLFALSVATHKARMKTLVPTPPQPESTAQTVAAPASTAAPAPVFLSPTAKRPQPGSVEQNAAGAAAAPAFLAPTANRPQPGNTEQKVASPAPVFLSPKRANDTAETTGGESTAADTVGKTSPVRTDLPVGFAIPENSKERVRLTQEHLNRIGCKVGQADGVAGANTRRGHADFLSEMGLEADLFPMGSAELLVNLATVTGTVCVTPPPIELTPSIMSGTWSFVTRCGAKSRLPNKRITGSLRIAHRGGHNYTGRARNSQGFNGDVSASLRGRQVTATINWGLLVGRVRMTGAVSEQALVIYGRDSNRCRFTARKK